MFVTYRRSLTWAVLGVSLLAAVGETILAQDAPKPVETSGKPVDEARVNELLKQLSDNDGNTRKTAIDALVAMGQPATPLLEKSLSETKDRKVRARVQVALDRIAAGTPVEGTAVNTGPTPITLDLPEVDAREAFDALFAQAKGEYQTQPRDLLQNAGDLPPVTVSVKNGNFWTVFLDLCKQTGLTIQQTGEPKLTLSKNGDTDWVKYPSVVSGPFLILAQQVSRSNSVNLARPENSGESLSISFIAYGEPALKIVRSSYQIAVDEATDDDGNSLVLPNRDGNGWSTGRQGYYNFNAQLNAKTATGNKIAKLKGKAKFGVQAEAVHIEADDIYKIKNLVKQAGPTRITIQEITKPASGAENGATYTVKISMTRPRNDDGADMGPNGLRLVDANGRELSQNGWGGSGGSDNYTYTVNFSRNNRGGDNGTPGEPVKIVWDIPTKIVNLDVPFEFKDIPLP